MPKELKPTTQQIVLTLNQCSDSVIKVLDFIEINKITNLEYRKSTLSENIEKFKNINLYIVENIEVGTFDNFTFITRNKILSKLQLLNQNLINFISNYSGYLPHVIDSIEMIYTITIEKGLDKKDRLRYDQKLEKLNSKEIELNSEIEKAELLIKNLVKADQNYNDIHAYYNTLNSLIKPKIQKEEVDIEDARQKVLAITNSLESFNTKVESSIIDYDNYLKRFKNFEDEYNILSKEFNDLIPKAVGESMANIYSVKEAEKKDRGYWWLWCLSGLILMLLLFGVSITWKSLDDIKNMNALPLLARYTLLSPIISAVIFASFQYLKEKRLQEEYGFKSTVALTIDLFKRIITRETDSVSKAILEKSINQIYTSPRELYFKFPNKDDHHNSFERLEKKTKIDNK